MASFFGKFRTFIGMEDAYDENYMEEEAVETAPAPRVRQYGLGDDGQTGDRYHIWENNRSRSRSSTLSETKERENVVFMQKMQNKTLESITSQLKIVVINPKEFDECQKLVDSLKARKAVIINLERLEIDEARKIFDFLSGATYALGGNGQKIANNIYAFLPENVDVSTNTEHSGITFGREDGNPWKV